MKLDKKLDTIWKSFLEPIEEKIIFGNYSKPKTLLELERLSKEDSIQLELLGFYLYQWMPYAPQAIDMIPFASTGEDGTYFAFLTDFGRISDLENAPIIMYCGADMNYENLDKGYLLFAKNILDFIAIITQTLNPGFVYEWDPRYTDFEKETKELIEDEPDDERTDTIEVLKNNLPLPKIDNLNNYYVNLFEQRSLKAQIKTNDGLNINFDGQSIALKQEINVSLDKEALGLALSKMDKLSRLKFYRDYGNLYHDLRQKEYLYVFDVLIEFLAKDGFHRESEVLAFDLKKQKAYILFHELKKAGV